MLLYLVGPWTTDDKTIGRVMGEAITKGHSVAYCSQLWAKSELMPKITEQQDKYLLARCDAVVRISSLEDSRTIMLMEYAESRGIPIYDHVPKLHITEQRCPQQVMAFAEFIGQMHRTHLKKNADYSPANILGTGKVGSVVRMWDKMARIMSLSGVSLDVECIEEPDSVRTNDLTTYNVGEVAAERIGLYKILFDMWDRMMKILNDAGFVLRVKYLSFTGEKEAQNEGILDSFIDLAVYCIIAVLVRAGVWGK